MRLLPTHIKFLFGAALSCTTLFSVAAPLPVGDFQAKFDIQRKGKSHGTASMSLASEGEQHQLLYHSDISWLIFSDTREERSTFSHHNGVLVPESYEMKREGTGKDRHYLLTFDNSKQQVLNGSKRKPLAVTWQAGWQDNLSYQLQLRLDLKANKPELNYQLIDKKGAVRHYQFKVSGQESLKLPYGTLDAVKVERVYKGKSDDQAVAWFAPSLDYALVRLWKAEDGVEQFDVILKEFSAQPVTVTAADDPPMTPTLQSEPLR